MQYIGNSKNLKQPFTHLVADLRALEYNVDLESSNNGEYFIDPRLPEFRKYKQDNWKYMPD